MLQKNGVRFLKADKCIPGKNIVYLIHDDWNDYHKWNTTFRVIYFDGGECKHVLGRVKIGQFDMSSNCPNLPSEPFFALDSEYFSLGFDENYYDNLTSLKDQTRENILNSLHDIAFFYTRIKDGDKLDRFMGQDVVKDSLLRFYSQDMVANRLSRLAHGKAVLTKYSFEYQFPREGSESNSSEPISLTFDVNPESVVPSNVHVIVGKNGAGKSSLLDAICTSVLKRESSFNELSGGVRFIENAQSCTTSNEISNNFSGVVFISFSAFDRLGLLQKCSRTVDVRFEFVGLKDLSVDVDGTMGSELLAKTRADLAKEFRIAVFECRDGVRARRWRKIMQILQRERYFQSEEMDRITDDTCEIDVKEVEELFSKLSSGHAIVLLTLARLVEIVDEKYLVLIDEPELHLHPPLLSLFMRALTLLLSERNAVSIIATHSPLVLQEIPGNCCWILHRDISGHSVSRPKIETFGERFGAIAEEVFGIDIEDAGYYHDVKNAVKKCNGNYESVLRYFSDALGSEARSLARAECAGYNLK